ncbi:rhodanese-like domain-containing protein [Gallibacterium melopsittaci]|uniref:Rhodanese-like domain-containing protein n=1 Tax=Gallibacterium melopsittaci TaxID=516063 RepID=A0ABV6HV97_9PAST
MPKAIAFASQHTVMVVAWVVVFFGTVYVFFKSMLPGPKEIDQATLTQLINKQNGIIIDLRSTEEFTRGHIAGSQNILPNDIKQKNIGKIAKHTESPVVVVCRSGLTARTSAAQLYKQGFKQVFTLKDGVEGWKAANLPLVKDH